MPDPTLTLPQLEVLVAADLGSAHQVAAVPGLPEIIAAEVVTVSMTGACHDVLLLGRPVDVSSVSPDLQDQLRAAVAVARLFAAAGWRESLLGSPRVLAADGSGDGGHGWGPWQLDIRSHADGVSQIRRQAPFSAPWWCCCAHLCLPVLLEALHEYPGNLEAGVARYNCGRDGVDAGVAAGDPSLHTTGHDYGRDVIQHVVAWWPT